MYESDAAIFTTMLGSFKEHNSASDTSHDTYPRKPTSQGHDLQG